MGRPGIADTGLLADLFEVNILFANFFLRRAGLPARLTLFRIAGTITLLLARPVLHFLLRGFELPAYLARGLRYRQHEAEKEAVSNIGKQCPKDDLYHSDKGTNRCGGRMFRKVKSQKRAHSRVAVPVTGRLTVIRSQVIDNQLGEVKNSVPGLPGDCRRFIFTLPATLWSAGFSATHF